MNVLVTGATGFIGRHVVGSLLEKGHHVTAVARDRQKAEKFSWFSKVRFIACDIHSAATDPTELLEPAGVVIHLAWPNLTDYNSLIHIEETLSADYRFLSALVHSGVKHLVIAGTCFEYGLQSGCLDEDMPACPVIPYAIAKDSLRRFLEVRQKKSFFHFQWARIFYPYGDGQKANSLLAQLHATIDRGGNVFPMSGGEQLRDYLPVEDVADRLTMLAETPSFDGIINICSGTPISVRRLVEENLVKRNASIQLKLGHFPYPSYEPMAFWGSTARLIRLEQLHKLS